MGFNFGEMLDLWDDRGLIHPEAEGVKGVFIPVCRRIFVWERSWRGLFLIEQSGLC